MTTVRLGRTWSRVVPAVVVICLLYPLVHNALLYTVNVIAPGVVRQHPFINLALIVWKDTVLAVMVLALWRRNAIMFAVIAAAGLMLFFTGRVLAIKEVLMPVVVATLLWTFRRDVLSFYQVHQRRIVGAAVGITLFLVTVGVAEMRYRSAAGIDSGNWTRHSYLMANNQYRCSKVAVTSMSSEDDLGECLGSQLNFYKLARVNDSGYRAIPALFLPVGDSVVFGMLLVNVLALVLFGRIGRRRPLTAPVAVLVVVLCASIFLTLNRFSSMVAVVMTVGYVVLAKRTWMHLALAYVILLALAAAYLREGGYLFASLVDLDTPSNLGHALLLQTYLSRLARDMGEIVDVWTASYVVALVAAALVLLRFGARWSFVARMSTCYAAGLLGFLSLAWFIDVPVTWFGSSAETVFPAESNFVKVLINHGAVGFLLYNGILALLLTTFFQLARQQIPRRCDRRVLRQQRWILLMVTCHMLLYQVVSPYVISGFVAFAPFIALWTVVRSEWEFGRVSLGAGPGHVVLET